MSSVPVSRRSKSNFEAQHQFYRLRDEITELILNQFGFDTERYMKKMERYAEQHSSSGNAEEITARYKAKCDNFYMKFIREEQSVVLNILRRIESEFTYGNSIYPSDTPAKLFEYIERRKHITAAIANCYVLKQEILYVIRVLPVDINKFYHYEKAIDAQIALYKGVRQSDNRFLKSKRKTIDVSKDITAISDCIIAILNKIVNAG